MQAYEWSHLIGEGARLNANPWGDASFGAYFFLMTGFHGTHVLSGVILLVTTAIRSAKRLSTADGIAEVLRHPDLAQALYDEGALISGDPNKIRGLIMLIPFARNVPAGPAQRPHRA